jgi:hypothetical protein
MNNAATDLEGFSRWLSKLLRPGIATGWNVTQRGAGANMSVDISAGDGVPMTTNTAPWDWSTAAENVTIEAASVNNRRDLIVAYTDLSVTNPSTGTPNNPGTLKFLAVKGTPATSPSDPNDAAIRATAVGASNPYEILARVSLTSSTTQITNAQITDLRRFVALNIQRLWGGASNTLGHLVPNQADGTVVTTTDVDTVTDTMLDYPRWWQEIGRTTLGVAGDTITISSLPARKYLRILVSVIPTGGTIGPSLRFNNDSGTSYAYRNSDNFGAAGSSGAGATSGPQLKLFYGWLLSGSDRRFWSRRRVGSGRSSR